MFLPKFELWLGEELSETPKIFLDQNMEPGSDWPITLANALADSYVLVPLWTKPYFTSSWCLAELSHMLDRQKSFFGEATPDKCLILPATIYDGDDIPDYAANITRVSLNENADPWTVKGSQTEEDLSKQIRAWAPAIAHAIERCAPEHDPKWSDLAKEDFSKLYSKRQMKQSGLPSLGDY